MSAQPDPFAALGDANRRAIVEELAEGEMSVQEIADTLPISRPAVSRHLRLLKEAGLVDDPLLTARGDAVPRRPPVRVVLDGRLRLALDSRLVSTARDVPTWVVTTPTCDEVRRSELLAAGVRVLAVPAAGDRSLPPAAVTALLWSKGVRTLLIEGGARVAASFLEAGLVNRMHVFRSSRTIGPAGVPGFPAGRGPGPWREVRREALGSDTLREFDHVPTFDTLIEGS